MDFQKVRIIALKDLQVLFSDRNLLLLMFVAPIALTAIIAGALGGFFGGSDSSGTAIRNIPVAIVNEDGGTLFIQPPDARTGTVLVFPNFGRTITDILIPPKDADSTNATLAKLISAQELPRAEAIKQVNAGRLAAAIIIPRDFSRSLNPLLNTKIIPTEILVYRDAGAQITGSVVASVVRSIVNSFAANFIGFYAVREAGLPLSTVGNLNEAITQELSTPPITLAQTTVAGEKVENAGGFNALQYFAPAMAIFFVMFTTAGAASSILDEQSKGTLPRMATTPTTRGTILAGKLGGTYLSGLAQLSILIAAMALLGVVFGQKNPVWGNNLIALVLVTLATTLAACGIGVFIGGVARTATQADTLGSLIVTFSGMLGGAFFPIATLGGPLALVSKLTLNYWATDAYSELARTSNLVLILPHIVVLLGMFAVYFSIGTALFNRRLKG